MRRKLFLATNNRGKVREYRSLLQNLPYELVTLAEQGITTVVSEVGKSLEENARLKATILAAESQVCGVFNIGSGRSITINELANKILSNIGIKIIPVHQKTRSGDVKHSFADIAKAKTLGYEPRYTLEEGLKRTIEEFRRRTV